MNSTKVTVTARALAPAAFYTKCEKIISLFQAECGQIEEGMSYRHSLAFSAIVDIWEVQHEYCFTVDNLLDYFHGTELDFAKEQRAIVQREASLKL